jgi:single-strand DNA-binding protein
VKEENMLNKAMLIGRLGKDPELSYTQSGTARCRFSLATSEKYRDNNGEMKEDTEWHNVIVWGKQAENCEKYLQKGRLVHIEGKITTRSWEDQQSGQKKYITEIKAHRVTFLSSEGDSGGGRRGGGNRGGGGNQGGGGPGADVPGQSGGYNPGDDDIPF